MFRKEYKDQNDRNGKIWRFQLSFDFFYWEMNNYCIDHLIFIINKFYQKNTDIMVEIVQLAM